MPCTSEGYSEDRPMTKFEKITSLERHHHAVETETEQLRKYATALEKRLAEIKALFPSLDTTVSVKRPKQTSGWKPRTYRDAATGKIPSDVSPPMDWLREGDY